MLTGVYACMQMTGQHEGRPQAKAGQRLPVLPETCAPGPGTVSRSRRSKDTGQERLEKLGYHQELDRQVTAWPDALC